MACLLMEKVSLLFLSKYKKCLTLQVVIRAKNQPAGIIDRTCFSVNTQVSSGYQLMSSASRVEKVCWKCGKVVHGHLLACDSCSAIQDVNPEVNYFVLFGLQQRFVINTVSLTTAFRELQAKFHPDKFAEKTQREQEYSAQCSSLLNIAFWTLINPIERGLYLIKLGDKELTENEQQLVDGIFLMDIMETNEELAQEGISRDKLNKIKARNKLTSEDLQRQLESAFETNDLEKAKQIIAKLKYYKNIEDKVKSLELNYELNIK